MTVLRNRLVGLGVASILVSGAVAAPPPRFPAGAVWHQDISAAPPHPDSATMISTLVGEGGWGSGNRFQIDFSFHVRQLAPGEMPMRYPVVQHAFYDDYYLPDSEPLGTMMPVPADAAFEGENGLTCNNEDNDCHLIVRDGSLLYELYSGNLSGGQLDSLGLIIWDLSVVYPPEGRGEHCTSADAAGFPIAPLLPNADEVSAAASQSNADLGHAIRFILPNQRMASDASLGGVQGRLYVRPATHAGGPSGPVNSVPYGARLRLRSNFPMAGYNAAAQVLLRTMQRYGIVLADGGNIALTFESDRHTTATWDGLGIDSRTFWDGSPGNRTPVLVSDFTVLDTGPRIGETYDCVRSSVVPGDGVFRNGFEN